MKVKKLLAILLMTTMLTACSLNGGGNKPDDGGNTPVEPSGGEGGEGGQGGEGGEGGEGGGQQQVTLESISVTAPTKTQYYVGDQALDLAGLVVTAHYSDNSQAAIAEGYTVGQVDFSAAGEKEVTVTYEGKTDSFRITVSAIAVTSIAIASNPTKTEYVEGEQIDLAGLTITVNYNNGGSEVISEGFTTNANTIDMSTAGEKPVTVTYEGQTASFNINVVAPALSRIEITTEPTKLAYNAGEAIDFTGMVVTAFFANNTNKVLQAGEYTTNADQLDMKRSGSKQVVVSFGGQSDQFDITVAAPEAWGDDTIALFNQYAYGVQIPFFYAYDLGLGDLAWAWDSTNEVLVATGANIANVSGTLEECEPILALFAGAAGWTVLLNGQDTWNYQVVFAKEVEGVTHYVQVDFGARSATGDWAGSGAFKLEICESTNAYSWADTGLEAKLKAYFETTEDIPDLPFSLTGAYMSADDIEYAENYINNGSSNVNVWIYSADTYPATIASTLGNANWVVKQQASGAYVGYSPLGTLKVQFQYVSNYEQTLVMFTKPETLPEYVNAAANYYELNPYAFSASSSGGYFYKFSATLGEGETLADLVPEYAAPLLADPADGFVAKQTSPVTGTNSTSGYDYAYQTFQSVTLGLEFEVFAYGYPNTSGEGYSAAYAQISVDEYHEIPQYVKDFCTVAEYDENEFSYDGDDEWIASFAFAEGATTLQEGLKALTDKLEADNVYAYRALGEVEESTLSDHVTPCLYVEYANANSKAELLVFNTKIQVTIYPYTPAPENTFIPSVQTLLGRTLAWDDEEQAFFKQELITGYPEGVTTNKEYATALADLLLNAVSMGFSILVQDGTDGDYIMIVYNDEGYVKINATSTTYTGYNVLEITAGLFDTSMPLVANLISAAMAIHLEEYPADSGVYSGSTFLNFGPGHAPADLAGAINYYIGSSLIAADALGFALSAKGPTGDGSYILRYTAKIEVDDDVFENWVVDLVITADSEGEYNGIVVQAYLAE